MKQIFNILLVLLPGLGLSQTWISVPYTIDGDNEVVHDFTIFQGKLIMGGSFDSIADFPAGGIISWDGVQYDSIADRTHSKVTTMSTSDTVLLFGGGFVNFADTPYDGILTFKDSGFIPVGSATHGFLESLTVGVSNVLIAPDGTMYIGANFSGLPSMPNAHEIVAFNPVTGWNDMNGGVNNGVVESVNDMTIFNGELIAGGLFPGIGNPAIPANNIARWDGSQWHALKSGLNYNVLEMVVDTMNNFLYVAGGFTSADGKPTGSLAIWDGYNWSDVGGLFDGWIGGNSLCMYRNELFMGGNPSSPGSKLENHIMRWDGENWYDLNGGLNWTSGCLIEYEDTLWVAGGFDTIGMGVQNLPSYRLAKWWMPANTHCNWLQPIIYVNDDQPVFKDSVVPLYNNNAYAQSWDWRIDGSSVYSNYAPTHTFTDTGWHDVEVVVSQDGCMDTAMVQVYVEEPVNILERQKINFEVFPNPSSGRFTIRLEQYYGIEFRITNIEGKTIYDQPATSTATEITTDGWANGNYIIHLTQEGSLVGSKTIVVE